jgi:hypothetical protein
MLFPVKPGLVIIQLKLCYKIKGKKVKKISFLRGKLMKNALCLACMFLLAQPVLYAEESVQEAPKSEESVITVALRTNVIQDVTRVETTDEESFMNLEDDIFGFGQGDINPAMLDEAIKQCEKIEEKISLSWKDKLRIVWAYLSLKADNAKAKIGEIIYDIGDGFVIVLSDVKGKLGQTKDSITIHVKDHKEDYIIGLLVTAFVVGGVAVYFLSKKCRKSSAA